MVVKDLYSTFKFEQLHSLQLEVSKLSENCLVHYSSSEDVYSYPVGPSGEQKRLSLLKVASAESMQQYSGAH